MPKFMHHAAAIALMAATTVLGACQQEGGSNTAGDAATVTLEGPGNARLLKADGESGNWLMHGRTYGEQRFSPLDQINAGNVGQLKLAWYHEFDTNRGQEATPLIVDGVIYLTTAWSKVFAIDARSGKQLWSYDPKVPPESAFKGCCDVVNRGAAFYDGKIYAGTFDGRLIALDAKSGKLVWETDTVDQSQPYTITGAPRVVRGKVLIGNGGAELGVRGYVTAYDAQSGKQVWRFYTIPGDPAKGRDGAASDNMMEKARGTWNGEFWKAGGGGTVWDSIVYDPELNQLYIGTGNGSPWNHRIRSQGKGDNLFLSSIVALDPDTGKYKWHYQVNPGESWDFTATQQIVLATLDLGKGPRKVLMQAPKNGFFYILDRTDGKLISAKPFTHVTWATGIDMKTGRPNEVPGARFEDKPFFNAPGGPGGHNWQPMSFSPKTGLMYIPTQNMGTLYANDPGYKLRHGNVNVGVDVIPHGMPEDKAGLKQVAKAMTSELLAWDPVHQKAVWRAPHDKAWNGGVMSTAGGLVFQGTGDGLFQAYDAQSGRKLWSFAAQSGVVAAPVSFAIDGKQYIAVLAGYGGSGVAYPSFDGPHPQPNGRLLVFALDGKASLPAFTPVIAEPTAPDIKLDPAQVTRGEALFAANCARCHGAAAMSVGVLPDLRRSGVIVDADAWQSVVIDGLLKDRGMVSFAKYLSKAEAEDVRQYVIAKSQNLKKQK